jgi:hypothetical protein
MKLRSFIYLFFCKFYLPRRIGPDNCLFHACIRGAQLKEMICVKKICDNNAFKVAGNWFPNTRTRKHSLIP